MQKDICSAIFLFGKRVQRKYNDGFKGLVRKVIAVFFNLFTTDSVSLFNMGQRTSLQIDLLKDRNKLPWFIGSDEQFAGLLLVQLSQL